MTNLLHRIVYNFTSNGDFVAVDHVTKAAICGYRGSEYANRAGRDKEATAREMIRDALSLRVGLPDLPSHTADAWNGNYDRLALRVGEPGTQLMIYD